MSNTNASADLDVKRKGPVNELTPKNRTQNKKTSRTIDTGCVFLCHGKREVKITHYRLSWRQSNYGRRKTLATKKLQRD
jgi:hypothetical protein